MESLRASRHFRQEFLHALRNGYPREESANIAADKVKDEFFASSPHLTEEQRQEKWEHLSEQIINYRILLTEMPFVPSDIPPKSEVPKEQL